MSNKRNRDITLVPHDSEIVSAAEFLRIYASERGNIESARPVPSPLGSKTLGKILVSRKRPIFKALTGNLG